MTTGGRLEKERAEINEGKRASTKTNGDRGSVASLLQNVADSADLLFVRRRRQTYRRRRRRRQRSDTRVQLLSQFSQASRPSALVSARLSHKTTSSAHRTFPPDIRLAIPIPGSSSLRFQSGSLS